ncbi:uncharacterized protein LOC129966631 [Argiope bruennichi]|uniref:uncharacterized protein LOC129966631 n=1 Tax=Argiope bruennichi TaxID=94029 RepID=UPI002494E058|nr:uncharacterized protein LOC129966631 [Argiope bruennichi]
MAKKSGTSSRLTIMLCEIILVSVFFQLALSFDLSDDEGHQNFFPLSHSDRQGYWTFVEEKSPSPLNRLGCRVFRHIPCTRTGRMLVNPELNDYDASLIPDYTWSAIDYSVSDDIPEGKAFPNKRGSIAFPPRIGRKKRSISDDDSGSDNRAKNLQGPLSTMINSDWSFIDDVEPDFYMRQDRRGNSRSRNAFVPRVGKKRSQEDLEDIEDKRALALTPRIGRASLIPRIGRNDPRFEVKSRGAFIPRIGRRASLTPRIGRSGSHPSNN